MTAELRDYGNGKMVVVWTNDANLRNKLLEWKSLIKVVEYWQQQNSCCRLTLVGVDMYFPKGKRRVTRLQKLVDSIAKGKSN